MASKKKPAAAQNTIWLWLALGVVVIIVVAFFINQKVTSNNNGVGASSAAVGVLPDIDTVPPNFTLTGLDGKTYTLSDLKGKAVWINFWATWCQWCQKEAPYVEAAHKQLGNSILVLGVDEAEGPNTVKDALLKAPWSKFGIDYPILMDRTQSVGNQYGLRGVPTSIFINKNGQVAAVQPGAFLDEQTILNDAQAAISGGNG